MEAHDPSPLGYLALRAHRPAPQPKGYHRREGIRSGTHVHDLRSLPPAAIAEADAAALLRFGQFHPGPKRVGLSRSLGKKSLTSKEPEVERIPQPDGSTVWHFAIRSPGAFGLRIHLSSFDVGSGSAIIYAEDKDGLVVRGPYTRKGPNGTGEFWSESLPGELVFVEVTSRQEPLFTVDELIHFDRDPNAAQVGESSAAIACHLDVMCYQVNPVARDATVQLSFMSGGLAFVCSGTLLDDLDAATFVPYLLTAYHCISTQAEVDTLQVTFFWQRSACNGTLPDFPLPTMSGGTLLALNPTNEGNDMSFIRLKGLIPPGAVAAGWSLADGLTLPSYGIHHPAGSYKRVTFYEPSDYLLCSQDDDYFLGNPLNESNEGGSSGSGLFDFNGRLLGQLYGRCGPGTDEGGNCADEDGWRALYGKFWVSYGIGGVGRWLEIGGTINVDRAYNGTELGTPTQPFNTVIEGYNLAWDGTRIKIRSGNYSEVLTLSKQLTILAEGGPVTIGR